MKRTEIAMIVLVASLAMMLTFTLVQSIFGSMVKQSVEVEKATVITDGLSTPAKRIFNEHAINPTVEVCVEASSEESQVDGPACERPMPGESESEDESLEQEQQN